MLTRAIARRPGTDFASGLTTASLGIPDLERMQAQHAAYVEALRDLGLEVEVLDALEGHPDATFVEDTAVVTPEVAVITRPGAPSRRGEEETVATTLARHRPIVRIDAPGTLDGGDVLIVERRVFIGLSERTNRAGADQLARILEELGYGCTAVPVGAGLHLKSSVNHLGGRALIVSESFAEHAAFREDARIVVRRDEEYACNTLFVNGHLIVPAGFPETRAALDSLGLPILELDLSEGRKMDGGLTCLSLRF